MLTALFVCVWFAGCRTNSAPSSANSVYSVNSSQPLASYNLSALPAGPGAGAGAITMAAAQAVQATAQVRTQKQSTHCSDPTPSSRFGNGTRLLLSNLAAAVLLLSDEGRQEDVQSESQLRGHQEQ